MYRPKLFVQKTLWLSLAVAATPVASPKGELVSVPKASTVSLVYWLKTTVPETDRVKNFQLPERGLRKERFEDRLPSKVSLLDLSESGAVSVTLPEKIPIFVLFHSLGNNQETLRSLTPYLWGSWSS